MRWLAPLATFLLPLATATTAAALNAPTWIGAPCGAVMGAGTLAAIAWAAGAFE